MWLQLVRREATVAEVASAQQVDRPTIMRIKAGRQGRCPGGGDGVEIPYRCAVAGCAGAVRHMQQDLPELQPVGQAGCVGAGLTAGPGDGRRGGLDKLGRGGRLENHAGAPARRDAAAPHRGVSLCSLSSGVGVRTAARILLEVGDGTAFPTPGHLPAFAGLAPVTRRSGASIRGEHPSRGGNKNLKLAFFLSAFAALSDPVSRAYDDRKRDQGKKHNAALTCLARRRCNVLHAMLRDRTLYQAPTHDAA